MADTATATDVRVGGAAEPEPLVAGANSAVRPMSMPIVDRVASGVGTPVTLIRPDHREVLHLSESPAHLAGPSDARNRGTVTGDLTAPLSGAAARMFLMHHRRLVSACSATSSASRTTTAPESHATSLAIPTSGEAWHNPSKPSRSPSGTADGPQVDLSAQLIG